MSPPEYLALLKQMRWRDVHLLAGSRSGSSVQERLLRTQSLITAIEERTGMRVNLNLIPHRKESAEEFVLGVECER